MKETKVKKDQIPINFSFISEKSFKNYIIGKDSLILDTLIDLSTGSSARTVFLIGKKSTGKSHLCSAVKLLTKKSTSFLDEGCIVGVDYEKILTCDLLIIDNIDKIISDHNLEEKLFALVNDFILNKRSMLITSTQPLTNTCFKLPDLSSRLQWDQVLTIPELTDINKIHVLQNIAQERGWSLPNNVSDYIMSHYKRDLYFLCNAINFIDETSLSLKKKITIPFIKKIIQYK
tara:strand:- start:48 stop:743 length:696 start_codon:yes stop_codon:yes gene_type:complete